MERILTGYTRRRFLRNAAELAAGSLAAPRLALSSTQRTSYSPKLSIEGYIWTQYFAAQKLTLAEGVEEALRETHQAGYRRIELSAEFFAPEVRKRTSELLEKFELSPESVYAGTTLHEPPAAEMSIRSVLELAAFLKPLGTRVIITNPSPKPNQERKSDLELRTQAHYINQLGAALRHRGVRLLLHHHTPELREQAREWWYELEHTSPKNAGCCVDVHWAYRGGQEVMPFVRRVGARLESLHLRNSQHGVWMEDFGPGDVDYAPLAAYLHDIKYQGFLVVELAYEKGTPMTRGLEEDLRRSRLYTEKVFGLTSA